MSDLFDGSWALVTGASAGLGEELARQLAARGANVVLTARSGDALSALAAKLGAAHGVQARTIIADLGADDGLATLSRELDALGVPIDHVFANAGFGAFGPFESTSTEAQVGMVRVNCEALVGIVHHAIGGMIARRRGGVLLVASTAGFQPTPMFATYGATKAFVRSFGEALAEEMRGRGVRVSVLCPGPVPTKFQSRAGSRIGAARGPSVLSAEQTITAALAGYEAGRVVIVPGAVNRIGATIASALPNRIVVPVVRRMMQARGRGE